MAQEQGDEEVIIECLGENQEFKIDELNSLSLAKAVNVPDFIEPLINQELRLYPKNIGENLKRILLVGSIRKKGLTARASWRQFDSTIIISVSLPLTVSVIKDAFHHELSSLILSKHYDIFPVKEWIALSGPYGNGGWEAIENGKASLLPDFKSLKSGFVCPYGSSSLENDINMFATFMMQEDSKKLLLSMSQKADVAKIITEKLNLLNAFYMKSLSQ